MYTLVFPPQSALVRVMGNTSAALVHMDDVRDGLTRRAVHTAASGAGSTHADHGNGMVSKAVLVVSTLGHAAAGDTEHAHAVCAHRDSRVDRTPVESTSVLTACARGETDAVTRLLCHASAPLTEAAWHTAYAAACLHPSSTVRSELWRYCGRTFQPLPDTTWISVLGHSVDMWDSCADTVALEAAQLDVLHAMQASCSSAFHAARRWVWCAVYTRDMHADILHGHGPLRAWLLEHLPDASVLHNACAHASPVHAHIAMEWYETLAAQTLRVVK